MITFKNSFMADSNTIKVVVLGAGYQGKSALIIKFVSNTFVKEYDPTIEDEYRKLIVVDEEPVLLDILDTAGQEEYASMSEQWMSEGQVFVLCYSVGSKKESSTPNILSRQSSLPDILTPYQHLSYLRSKICQIKGAENIPMFVVGTKCDLPQDQRRWTYEEGQELAREFGCQYIEVSAKDDTNLDKLWENVARTYKTYIETGGSIITQRESISHRRRSTFGSIGSIAGFGGSNNSTERGGGGEDNSCCCDCFGFIGQRKDNNNSNKSIVDLYCAVTTPKTPNHEQEGDDDDDNNTNSNSNSHSNRKPSPYNQVNIHELAEMAVRGSRGSRGSISRSLVLASELGVAGVDENGVIEALEVLRDGDENMEDDDIKHREEFDPKEIAKIIIHSEENNSSSNNETIQKIEKIEKKEKKEQKLSIPTGRKLSSRPSRKQSRTSNKSSITSDFGTDWDHVKLYPVAKLPKDEVFDPILSLRNWRIRRRFNFKRFIVSIICGICLPIVCFIQTLAFWLYIEGKNGGFYYPKQYKYDVIHYGILLDFLGVVIGRKPGQDPEITKDRKWFLRQTWWQKVARIISTIWISFLYVILFYNLSKAGDKKLRVSFMETYGPILLFSALWIMLSLWIGYDTNLKPRLPPLTRLRKINLYFGENYDQTTSAYKFLRVYLSTVETQWKLSWRNIIIWILLAIFYALIPGLTRLTIGDPSDGLEKKKFMTYKELPVEIGALIVNAFLMGSLLLILELQYSKYLEHYKEWMYVLTMFLMNKACKSDEKMDDYLNGDELDDAFSDIAMSSLAEHVDCNDPKNLYLSLKRRSNALGWLEIRSFLACEVKLFFGEQELPILWMLAITTGLAIFSFYRVFFVGGNALESVVFDEMIVLTLICLASLVRMMLIAAQFEELQGKQASLIETQKFMMRCHKESDDPTNRKKDEEEAVVVWSREKALHSLSWRRDRWDNDNNNKNMESSYNELRNELTWYESNVGFIDDMLSIVERKHIIPKLYRIKLNSVLIPVFSCVVILTIIVLLKLFF